MSTYILYGFDAVRSTAGSQHALWLVCDGFLALLGCRRGVRRGTVEILRAVSPAGRPSRAGRRQPAVPVGVGH